MKKIFLLLVITFNLSSCGKFLVGTDTGNPASGQQGFDDCTKSNGRCLKNPYVLNQVGQICRRLNTCFQNDEAKCYQNILEQIGLNDVLTNLSVSTYSQLTNKYNQTDKVKVDSISFGQCIQSIQELECTSDILNAAYSPEKPDDFTNIHKILYAHVSCLNIYSEIAK